MKNIPLPRTQEQCVRDEKAAALYVVRDDHEKIVGIFTSIGMLIDRLERRYPLYSVKRIDNPEMGTRRIALVHDEDNADIRHYFLTPIRSKNRLLG